MNSSIELLWVNSAEMNIGLQMQEHSHICYQMYYVLHGDPVFVINGVELAAHPASFFYIPPNIPHRMLPLSSGKMHAHEFKFFIHDEYIRSHLPDNPAIINGDHLTEKMLSYIEKSWKNKDENNMNTIIHILCSLLSCFFLDQLRYDSYDSNHIDTSQYNSITRSIIAYIENNFQTHFSLQKIATALNYNKNYLSSVFSKNTGITIMNYLNMIRIRQAVIFFAFYNQDVFTAYESIGFTNPSHFSRVFKSLVGISPRNFKFAFSTVDRHILSQYFIQEPILNYCICSLGEAFSSLKSIGNAAKEIIQNTKKEKDILGL